VYYPDLHGEYYYSFLIGEWEPIDFKGPFFEDVQKAGGVEQENIKAAWRWMIATGRTDELVRAADGLWLAHSKVHYEGSGARKDRNGGQGRRGTIIKPPASQQNASETHRTKDHVVAY
jgi:hypothetical protein